MKSRRDDLTSAETFAYDPAGLATRHTNSRGFTTRQYYDALGRLLARVTPEARDSQVTVGVGFQPYFSNPTFPHFPTPLLGGFDFEGVVAPGDVETYSYDAAGRMLTANNRDARITRGYFPNGALRADTLRIRNYDPTDTVPPDVYAQHRQSLTFTVDKLGRRTARTDAAGVMQTYAYHDSLGVLTKTAYKPGGSSGDSIVFTFGWDAAGRLRTTGRPGGATGDSFTYDGIGRLTASSVAGTFFNAYDYDARGKQSWRQTTSGLGTEYSDQSWMHYDGFGAVIARGQLREFGGGDVFTDEYAVDALGNVRVTDLNRGWAVGRRRATYSYNGERLTAHQNDPLSAERDGLGQPVVTLLDATTTQYNAAGSQIQTSKTLTEVWNNGTEDLYAETVFGAEIVRSYYDATERLRQSERWVGQHKGRHTVQEYRYDALGRRVLVRTRRDATSCVDNEPQALPPCIQSIERFYWDGDQLLTEIRRHGRWNLSTASLDSTGGAGGEFFGRVDYVHALGIDDPLLVSRSGAPGVFVPLRSGRGGFEAGIYVWNASGPVSEYHWPSRADGVYPGNDVRHTPPVNLGWYGSLLDNKTDASGMVYMRNRYYDPASGRFTQRDPIGLAGGLNQYGFAAGDPVNYQDPFGLCAQSGGDTTTVEVCETVADLPVLRNVGVKHRWFRIGSWEAGLGQQDGGVPGEGDYETENNLPFFTQTEVTNHSGRGAMPGATCRAVANVSTSCVRAQMTVGAGRGAFGPGNNCQTLVNGFLQRCGIPSAAPADATRVQR